MQQPRSPLLFCGPTPTSMLCAGWGQPLTVAVLQAKERGNDAEAALLRIHIHVWLRAAGGGCVERVGSAAGREQQQISAACTGLRRTLQQQKLRGGARRAAQLTAQAAAGASHGVRLLHRRVLPSQATTPNPASAAGDQLGAPAAAGCAQWEPAAAPPAAAAPPPAPLCSCCEGPRCRRAHKWGSPVKRGGQAWQALMRQAAQKDSKWAHKRG